MANRSDASKAKRQLAELLSSKPGIGGVGLTRIDGDWAIEVEVFKEGARLRLPASIDGVRVQRHELESEPQAHVAAG
jgi:hypothetical protein